MSSFADVLEDLIPTILSYLDDSAKMNTARCISRSWYHAVVDDHACLALKTRGTNFHSSSEEMRLQGSVNRQQQERAPALPYGERRCAKRTRGHLQEPCMDFLPSSTEGCSIPIPLSGKRTKTTAGSVFVQIDPRRPLLSLDLNSTGGTHIVKANLSSVQGLRVVSARGCRCLTHLSLPPTLLGLDASSCLHLKQILFPLIQKQQNGASSFCERLQSLNLSGCLSLHTIQIPNPNHWAINLREVGLSSCLALPSPFVATLLGAATQLKILSLRSVATDEILHALPRSTLKLVDVAFSQQATDQGVNAVLEKSKHLERVNLRGCRQVSSECYNRTPILLQQRLEKDGSPEQQEMTRSRRKGDYLFYLVTKEPKRRRQKQQHGSETTDGS